MQRYIVHEQFYLDYKECQEKGLDPEEMRILVSKLLLNNGLPSSYSDREQRDGMGSRVCCLQKRFFVIYKIEDEYVHLIRVNLVKSLYDVFD